MKPELDAKLVKAFPLLYADRNAPMQQTCMCWGFETGDGWYDLIYRLSEKLEKMIKEYEEKNPEAKGQMKASQVKSKLAGLRFYMTSSTDEMEKEIDKATDESIKTCEICGNSGEVREDRSWITTLCDECNKKDNK